MVIIIQYFIVLRLQMNPRQHERSAQHGETMGQLHRYFTFIRKQHQNMPDTPKL